MFSQLIDQGWATYGLPSKNFLASSILETKFYVHSIFYQFFFIKLTAYVLRVRCYCWHLHFTKHSPLITMYMQVHFKLVLIYHNYLFCWSIIAFIFGLQLHDNFKSFFMIVWTKTIIDECNWQKEPNKRRQLFRKKPLLITI